jgi:heme-degrading monooxygenase HmoA
MIERLWDAIAKPGMAAHYIHHLLHETFPALAKLEGFERATILRRELDDKTQFRIVTTWKDETYVKSFAGEDPEVAVVPDRVAEMMISLDLNARHF